MNPIVIASANGNQFTNGGTETCVERAYRLITEGRDVLDAIVDGVTIVELDPDETSVGLGGLPNAEGVVQLDACCMHGPLGRAGAVAALEGIAESCAVARRVMTDTTHHLLAGQGAQDFAQRSGFTVRRNLMTPTSRALWIEWKRRLGAAPDFSGERGYAIGNEMSREGLIDANHLWGTIACLAIGSRGELCGATATSGLAWKIPGRVGDTPILGAGLFVRDAIGAAAATGRGEATMSNLSSFAVVENLRGRHPTDAGMAALREIAARTTDRRLLNARGQPNFNVKLYVLAANGEHASVALHGGDGVQFAVCTENGAELRRCESLFGDSDQFID